MEQVSFEPGMKQLNVIVLLYSVSDKQHAAVVLRCHEKSINVRVS